MARRVLPTAIALGLLVPAGFAPLALAQQADEMVVEIVTIASRRTPRSNTDSSVPVYAISDDEFVNMELSAIADMLNTANTY